MRKKDQFIFDISDVPDNNFFATLTRACSGLIYVSETDSPIVPFVGHKTKKVTPKALLESINTSVGTPIQCVGPDRFFDRLTRHQDWYGEAETASAKRFKELKQLMESELRELSLFRVGQIQIDIYVIGLDRNGTLAGIQTRAIET